MPVTTKEKLPVKRSEDQPVRPFIKWAGGKSRLLPKLLPLVPRSFDKYHEPFLGGGAMLLAVGSRATRGAICSDWNEEVVAAWNAVKDSPDLLSELLSEYVKNDSKDFYYEVRSNQFDEGLRRAAHFIYLNRTSWNGLYRVNKKGEFNVPWGDRVFTPPSNSALSALSAYLRDVEVSHRDFREALSAVKAGDFVYLDPPYLKVSDTSKFDGYTQRRFGLGDLEDLASECRRLTTLRVPFLLSNRDSDAVRELFSEHSILPLTVRRSVAAQNRRDVEPIQSPEVIISNKLVLTGG